MTVHPVPAQAPSQILYTVEDATKVLRLSRAELYEQMRAGRLRYVKIGRARRITARAIAEFVALLESESEVAA
jgi:excisionase family DNA binding protein